jgi:SAM-dependent methyltransferase
LRPLALFAVLSIYRKGREGFAKLRKETLTQFGKTTLAAYRCPRFVAAIRRKNLAPANSLVSLLLGFFEVSIRHCACTPASMFQPAVSSSDPVAPYASESSVPHPGIFGDTRNADRHGLFEGVRRRWLRERRRRKVGRAYDMALEIARFVPANSRVLDVGCGNGFIAHHLSSLLATKVIGIDLDATTQAAIDYRQFDGINFPVEGGAVDAVLLCYVLHHAQDLNAVMKELRRVLSDEGIAVVYEDIPEAWWDRIVCWTHDLKWRKRTGRCRFRSESEWRDQFSSVGFRIIREQRLSRWRNFAHPVRRRLYLLQKQCSG